MSSQCRIVPVALLEQLMSHDEPEGAEHSAALQELRELIAGPASLPLDEDLRYILGRANFSCMSTAQGLRSLGYDIPEKSEDEQAVTIHWMLSHYLRDPEQWRENASEEFQTLSDTLKRS